MTRLIKLIAIPAVILGASIFSTPTTAKAHWGYGYGSFYTPYYSSYYYPSYRVYAPVYSVPVYNYGYGYGGFCY